MNKSIRKEGKSILLCCGRARCPSIRKSEKQKDRYDITDDFGASISLTRDQLLVIKDAVKELDNS